MTRSELVRRINSMITQSYSIPVSLPDDHVELVIDMAQRYFYKNVDRSVMRHFYVVPKAEFQTPEFKEFRRMRMPDCVAGVYEVREISGGARLGNIDRDFSENRLMAAELFLNSAGGDALVHRTAAYAYYDVSRVFIMNVIQFDFSDNNHMLRLQGRDPQYDVLIRCHVKLDEQDLYEDEMFIRYCLAQAKVELGRMLGFFTFQLPGGVVLNYGDLKTDGQTELQEIKEEIKDEQSVSDLGFWQFP